MPPNAAQLLADVLALPAEQRRELVAEVLATLDDGPAEDPDVVAAIWGDEIHRRIERRLAGAVQVLTLAGGARHVARGVECAA